MFRSGPEREETTFLAAVVQLNSSSDNDACWRSAEDLVRRAAAQGARLVATPENTNFLGPHEEKVRRAESLDGPTCSRFAALADELSIHLLLGSFNEKVEVPGRCANTSVLFGPDGGRLATYRKIHLFDVDIPEGVRFLESETVAAGDRAVVARTDLASVGLSICYDLRFPELYRRLVAAGAELLMVPSAFTALTGRAHWTPLLRARAIETQCWLLAPAQHGRHDDHGLRESWGHASIVSPWGEVVAEVNTDAENGTGLAVAEIDLERLREIRRSMPVATHRRVALDGTI